MVQDTQELVRRVEAIVSPYLSDMEKELVLVEYLREQGGWVLRLYVDNMGGSGILLDDLAEISRLVGPMLDVEEIIRAPYRLEVSSPGLDRPLGRIEDCDRFAGKAAVIKTRESLDGRKNFKGIIEGREGNFVLLKEHETVHRIPWDLVRKARLKYTMGADRDGQ